MTLDETERFAFLLGSAVIRSWGMLPQEVQQQLFEGALAASGKDSSLEDPESSLRERLAVFLHHEHPRTRA